LRVFGTFFLSLAAFAFRNMAKLLGTFATIDEIEGSWPGKSERRIGNWRSRSVAGRRPDGWASRSARRQGSGDVRGLIG